MLISESDLDFINLICIFVFRFEVLKFQFVIITALIAVRVIKSRVVLIAAIATDSNQNVSNFIL